MRTIFHYVKHPSVLLSIGGDDRLTVNPNNHNLNKYLSSTSARDDILRRGSCTCSTVDPQGAELAEKVYQSFFAEVAKAVDEEKAGGGVEEDFYFLLNQACQNLVQRVRSVFHLSSAAPQSDIVLFPSGSDAEFLPLLCGALLSAKRIAAIDQQAVDSIDVDKVKVYNVITAAGEVGSGTPNAAAGQHFSAFTPNSKSGLKAGQVIDGFLSSRVECISYPPRNSDGGVAFQEEAMMETIGAKLESNPHAVVVLHAVVGSKTGLIYPAQEVLNALTERYQERVQVVIDACQLRCRLDLVGRYLAKGYICLVTASKFFTGPPFSGAVLLPSHCVALLESHADRSAVGQKSCLLPEGLADYLTPCEVSDGLPAFKAFLASIHRRNYNPPTSGVAGSPVSLGYPHRWGNLGLYLRWSVGLDRLERYASLPSALVADFTHHYISFVKREIKQLYSPFLTVMDDAYVFYQENLAEVNSIVSILPRTIDHKKEDGKSEKENVVFLRDLTAAEIKAFHQYLTLHYVQRGGEGSERTVLIFNQCKVLLGQPVKIKDNGSSVVRIALGADMVLRCLEGINSPHEATLADHQLALKEAFLSFGHADSALDYLDNVDPADTAFLMAHYRESPAVSALREQYIAKIHSLLAEDELVLAKMAVLARDFSSFDDKAFLYTDSLALLPSAAPVGSIVNEKPLVSKYDLQKFRLQVDGLERTNQDDQSSFHLSQLTLIMKTLQHEGRLSNTTILYDLNAIYNAVTRLHKSFTSSLVSEHWIDSHLHCFAVKSCPISFILSYLIHEMKMGCECASINEVKHSLSLGCPAHQVIYDSPCKSATDLLFALVKGVTINCNSYHEVYEINKLLLDLQSRGVESRSRIGLRVNPLVGSGSITQLSTATLTSKFGVPIFSMKTLKRLEGLLAKHRVTDPLLLPKDEVVTMMLEDEEVHRLLAAFKTFGFLRGVMSHVGSQGMPVSIMTLGVQRIVHLADLIDLVCGSAIELSMVDWHAVIHMEHVQNKPFSPATTDGATKVDHQRIDFIDIGGGLPANYASNAIKPSFEDYAQAMALHLTPLRRDDLPDNTIKRDYTILAKKRVLITEFGKSVITKTGLIVSKVEDVLTHQLPRGQSLTAVVHAGADLLLRTAYVNDKFAHRFSFLAAGTFQPVAIASSPRDSVTTEEEEEDVGDGSESLLLSTVGLSLYTSIPTPYTVRRPPCIADIVGPLCFSGDVLAEQVTTPTVERGDYLVLHDTGANTLSLFSKHCSRLSPRVIVCRGLLAAWDSQEHKVLLLEEVREEESLQALLSFWK